MLDGQNLHWLGDKDGLSSPVDKVTFIVPSVEFALSPTAVPFSEEDKQMNKCILIEQLKHCQG